MFGTKTGTVTEFDAHRGLGTIEGDDGHRYPFHCTQIADGTRDIGLGTKVRFEIVAGALGRLEAATLTPRY
jgi:CspA family cold shock protein